LKFQDPRVELSTRSRFQHESCTFSAAMALLVLHKLFSLLRAHWSRTRRPDPRNFVHPEPELSHGDPRKPLHGRKVTRSALGVWCDYTIRELLDEELYIVHEGQAVVVNIGYPAGASYFNVSRGLLDASPSSGGGGTTLSRRGALPIASRWLDSTGSVCGGIARSDLKNLCQDTGSRSDVGFPHDVMNMLSHSVYRNPQAVGNFLIGPAFR